MLLLIQLNKVIFIDEDKFDQLINDSRYIDVKAQKGHKRLNPNALNDHLNDELSKEENRNIKITHLSSTINHELTRKDSKYLTAYGKCSFSPFCQVNYIFRVKDKVVVDNKVGISIEIKNSHDHDTQDKNIKKLKNENFHKAEKDPSKSARTKSTNNATKNKQKAIKSPKPISPPINDTEVQEDVNEIFNKILETDFPDWNYKSFTLFDFSNEISEKNNQNQTIEESKIEKFQLETLELSAKRRYDELDLNESLFSLSDTDSINQVDLGLIIENSMSTCATNSFDLRKDVSNSTDDSFNEFQQINEWDEIIKLIIERDLSIFDSDVLI